jgi:hypothetical protein
VPSGVGLDCLYEKGSKKEVTFIIHPTLGGQYALARGLMAITRTAWASSSTS